VSIEGSVVEATWERLRAQAAEEAQREPVLARRLEEYILKQPSLARVIATCVAEVIAGELSRDAVLEVASELYARQPALIAAAAEDIRAYMVRDPSCRSELEVVMVYKGFKGLQCHRIAHGLWRENRQSLARHVQGRVSEVLSMDIHPAAQIGSGIFIDHGTGIVIGETAVVHDNVSMLHSVTLGGTGKVASDRHPKVREGVMIGAGAKILGNIEIGGYSKIAAGSVVLHSVPPHSTAAGVPARIVGHPKAEYPYLEMEQDIE